MKTLVNFSLMLLLCLVMTDLKAQSVCVATNNYDVYLTTLGGQTISINNLQPSTDYYLVCEGPINNGRAGTQSDPFYNVAYFLLAGIGITPNTLNGPTYISDTRGDNGIARRRITTDATLGPGQPLIYVAPAGNCTGSIIASGYGKSPN